MKDSNFFKKCFDFIRQNKWLCAFIATAVVLVVGIIVTVVMISSSPDIEQPPAFEAGDEVGVYYYDVADGEMLLTLSQNRRCGCADLQCRHCKLRPDAGSAGGRLGSDL